MNTALRIASVTQVLRDLLNNGLIDHDVSGAAQGNVTVTAWPPDRVDMTPETSQLNLFMYQVTPNQGWRNVGQPSFNRNGKRISNPPLAIDLHYLLTAYGSAELHTDILLGYGIQLLHETMVLDRDAIRRSLAPPSSLTGAPLPPSLKLLSTSELAEQVEMITVTPELLSIEDISKLWAAFGVKYRPTVAYKATVVLIESDKSTMPGLPVKERKLYVKPFKPPVLEKVMSQAGVGQPFVEVQKILIGFRVMITGNQLASDIVRVSIDGSEIDEAATGLTINDMEISFDVPSDLKAGLHEVQVVHPVLMGSPPEEHKGVISNSLSFVLYPAIVGNPIPTITSTNNNLVSGSVALKLSPPVYPGQRVMLLLNELSGPQPPLGYSFEMRTLPFSPPIPVDNITIPITDVKKGNYLVRVTVEQSESPLTSDMTGKFISPAITL